MAIHASPSLSERYQQATNYTPASVRGHPGLDFSRQPPPFKHWHQARRVPLPPDAPTPDPGPLDLARLGRLLHRSYGVTLVREAPGMSMHFRAAPSAGGLYPTELYVATRGVAGLPDGLFAYDAKARALVVCWEGDFGADLRHAAFDHPAIAASRAVLIGTAVHERSAWRYGDRAYRRILLDCGHVLGGAIAAAPADGLRVVPVASFRDARLEDLLLVDRHEEGALLLGAVLEGEGGPRRPAPLRAPVAPAGDLPGEGDWIPRIHDAGRMDEAAPVDVPFEPAPLPVAVAPAMPLPAPADPDAAGVLHAIRHRRSTRVFRQAPVSGAALAAVLGAADPADGLPQGEALETWVVAAGVAEVSAGVHRYDPMARTLAPVRLGDPRDALHRCLLGQELGRDAAFTVVHTADLGAAVARHGDRVYRSLHLEAGIRGHQMSLAAVQAGLGASGIGGYFDEPLAGLLGCAPDRAVVYVTTIGVPA